ncbi:MAG: amidohydrolase family protein [Clostridiales bacterium]|jgi:N-acyl-D-aspartate/D-glutamate deacylase|nr:amidohydrolase family protein [Clostridiales bacterium]
MKIQIRHGLVYDGENHEGRAADILIKDGRIAAIAPRTGTSGGMPLAEDAVIIDAAGCVVTPGFIDIHRHCDVAPFARPDFGKLELAQGITTAIAGNCGFAPVPTSPAWRKEAYSYMEPVTGPVPEGMEFTSYSDYTDALERCPLPINMGFLVGAGAVRTAVKGFAKTPVSPGELERMVAFVREGLQAGAYGISFGLMYQPECWSAFEDLVALARPVSQAGGLLCAHIRCEGGSLLDSVREIIDIAGRAGVRLNISHFKATGLRNWGGGIYRAIELIERAADGVPSRAPDVTADFYPYTSGSTSLLSLVPPTMLKENMTELYKELGTKAGKERLRSELGREHSGWDNMAASIGWERILVSSSALAEHGRLLGKNLTEAADLAGYENPADLAADLIAGGGNVGIILMSMCQADVDAVARLPYTALISDSLYSVTEHPHPRLYGAFPKFLREYVFERKVCSFGQAIQKMTAMPAKRLGLKDRGRLLAGCRADVLVFDPRAFTDCADFTAARPAENMKFVILNGEVVWRGALLEGRAGKLLKRGW